jgi:prolyl oligopeptidase
MVLAAALLSATMTPQAQTPDDPHLWLEAVQDEKALSWVRERNAVTRRQLEAHPRFTAMRERFLEILNSRDRIPYVTRQGDWFYNLWRDDKNKRGLWRRTTLAEYRKPQPAWETVLDLDALATREKENWVWSSAACFGPSYRRCLLSLSRGGADAVVMREFDTVDKRFVERGFALPEAKSDVAWIDENTIFVGTDFGPGSLTDSGYPRVIKRWRRGQLLAEAAMVFEGEPQDVAVSVTVDRTPGFERTLVSRSLDFYNTRQFLLQADGKTLEIDKPRDASVNFHREQLLLELRSDLMAGGTTYPRGSLLAAEADGYLRGLRRLTPLFTPSATRSMAGYTVTRSRIVLNVLDNVASRLEEWHLTLDGWQRRDVKAPFPGTLGVSGVQDALLARDTLAEHYLMTSVDFLTPDSLWLARSGTDRRERLKSRPAFFDNADMRVEQRFANSKDGTRVPYFVVWPRGAKADGTNPTLLYGYGGFEQSMQPWYSGGYCSAWYSQGGVLVVANIRGGGEFGPGWHQAAIKAHKQKSYDDFIAVAEDLVANKITSPRHLGIQGGSNGGLLVGAVMLQRPELFNAVVCQVPLLDMKRYHKLLAGASWMAEYGNPDEPADWATIAGYSPYQNVKPGVKLPKVLFTTSTRDDRVHPGHARKMAARMLEQGHALLYYENIEGGHGGAADNIQRADILALEFAFLWQQLGR